MAEKLSNFIKLVGRPLFIFLTAVAIIGLFIQIFLPDLYFSNQAILQEKVESYRPYDMLAFVSLQVVQVIIAPVSHYAVSILGGALYGPWLGGILNWIGRIIGHFIAYWLGRILGQKLIRIFFNESDFNQYKKFINGTKETLYIRLIILFLMIFLPLFPDDEISYLVGLGALHFPYYLIVLILGHLGGSFALAYLGAGVDSKDPYFWILTCLTIFLAGLLIYFVRRFGKISKTSSNV